MRLHKRRGRRAPTTGTRRWPQRSAGATSWPGNLAEQALLRHLSVFPSWFDLRHRRRRRPAGRPGAEVSNRWPTWSTRAWSVRDPAAGRYRLLESSASSAPSASTRPPRRRSARGAPPAAPRRDRRRPAPGRPVAVRPSRRRSAPPPRRRPPGLLGEHRCRRADRCHGDRRRLGLPLAQRPRVHGGRDLAECARPPRPRPRRSTLGPDPRGRPSRRAWATSPP